MRGHNRETFKAYPAYARDVESLLTYMHEHDDDTARVIAGNVDLDVLESAILASFRDRARLARLLGCGPDYRRIVNVGDPLMLRASEAWNVLMAAPTVPMSDETGRSLDRMIYDNVITVGGRELRFTRWISRNKDLIAWLRDDRGIAVDRFLSMLGDSVAACKRDALISANPIDLLLMSEHGSFRSCHRIAGEYGNGPIAYLRDDQTFMIAVLDNDRTGRACFPHDQAYGDGRGYAPTWRRLSVDMSMRAKTGRVLAWLDPDTERKIAYGRAYGVMPSAMIAAISVAVTDAVSSALGISPKWAFRDDPPSMSIDNAGSLYFDHTWTRYVRHETADRDGFSLTFGPALCMTCGGDTCDSESWACADCAETGTACHGCGDRCHDNDMRSGPDGYAYCESCHDETFSYCEDCDSYDHADDFMTVYRRGSRHESYVCGSCASDYTACHNCGERHDDDHTYHAADTGRDYCGDCMDAVTACETCGDWHETVISGADDLYRCEDCHADTHATCAGTRITDCDTVIKIGDGTRSEHDGRERCDDCHAEHDQAETEIKRIEALIAADYAAFQRGQLCFPFLPELNGYALRDW